jgi:hypothetical protein
MSYEPKESELKGWFKIPGNGYFYANKDGMLKNISTGYETYGSKDDKGYMRACQWDNVAQVKKDLKVHHLICIAFHGPCPTDMECGHKDDVRDNNKSSNLEWVTRAENMKKANDKLKSTKW